VVFENATGISEYIEGQDLTVPYLDLHEMSTKIITLYHRNRILYGMVGSKEWDQMAFNYRINSNGLLSVGTGSTQTGRFTINENSGYPVIVTNQKNSNLDQLVMQYNGQTRSVFDAMGNLGIGVS